MVAVEAGFIEEVSVAVVEKIEDAIRKAYPHAIFLRKFSKTSGSVSPR